MFTAAPAATAAAGVLATHAAGDGGAATEHVSSELVDMSNIEKIKQLKAQYFRFIDTKDWERWRALFTADLHAEAEGLTFDSRDDFVDTVAALLADVSSVHHGHMPEISIAGRAATGIWALEDYLEFPGGDLPVGIRGYGHYHERYRLVDGQWLISELVLTRLRVDPLEGGFPEGGPWS